MKKLAYKIKPWDHQQKIIDHVHNNDLSEYALFLDLGTGKSLTTVNILRGIYQRVGGFSRTLIIGPKAVKQSWKREFLGSSNIPEALIHVSDGTGKKRLKQLQSVVDAGPGVFIINYEALLNKEFFQLLMDWGINALVCDESHLCKNPSSKRTKALVKLADLIPHKFILTGTPILNSPMDIYSQFRILDGGKTFGTNFFAFRAKYFYDSNSGMPSHVHFPNWKALPGIEKELHDLIYQKAVRLTKKECLDLPPFVRTEHYVGLGKVQARMYKDMLKDFVAYLDDKACVATIALTKALRLQQLLCGYVVDDNGGVTYLEDNPRIKELGGLISDLRSEHKTIVWSSFSQTYDLIEKEVTRHLLKGEYMVRLVGGMTTSQTQDSIDKFQNDPMCRVILVNQRAGGAGITLTSSSYSIYYAKGFSLGDDWQSEARNHRGGSELHEKVTRIDLVAKDTIDEQINAALKAKVEMSEQILRRNLR